MGLMAGTGIVLAWYRMGIGRLVPLRADMESNVYVVGPKGSGKTTVVTIPTILTWEKSLVCLDLKGELTRVTFPYRRRMNRQPHESDNPVYVFAPGDEVSDHYNPLDHIRWGTIHEVKDLQRFNAHIAKADATTTTDRSQYYVRESRSALLMVELYMHHAKSGELSPGGILDFFATPQKPIRQILEEMLTIKHKTIRRGCGRLLRNTNAKLDDIWSAASGWLAPWEDELLAWNMHDTTIPMADLQMGQNPMTLYLKVSPEDIEGRLRPVMHLIFDQMILWNTMRGTRDYRHEVLCVMEDMAELGRFEQAKHITAFRREDGWRLLAVAQSANQIWEAFGQHTSLFDNLDTWVVFGPNHPDTAEFFARKLDKETVVDHVTRGRDQAETKHARWLMTPGELMRLKGKVLVLVSQEAPIVAEGLPYFKHRDLKRLVA
jgi:type IV secretion system protein VirD4